MKERKRRIAINALAYYTKAYVLAFKGLLNLPQVFLFSLVPPLFKGLELKN
jgi:hypothetical protein